MRKITFWISLIVIFTMPWETAIESDSLGTISKIFGLILAAIWFVAVFVPLKARKPHVFVIVFYLFMLWHISSYFWTIDPNKTLDRIPTYVQLFGLIYIIWDLYTTPESIKAGLQAYILGAWVSIGGILYNFANDVRFSYTRFSAFDFDVNNIGIIMALGIPVAWHLGLKEYKSIPQKIFRILNILYIPTSIFAIVLTASRTASLAIFLGIIYISITFQQHTRRMKFAILAALFISLLISLPYIPQSSITRISSVSETVTEGDYNGRLGIWAEGTRIFYENPIFGIGSNAFSSSIGLQKQAHNGYLAILVDLGIVGFAIFGGMVTIITYQVLHHDKETRAFWVTVLMILAMGIFSLNWIHRKQTWIFPILAVANTSLVVKQIERKKYNWEPKVSPSNS